MPVVINLSPEHWLKDEHLEYENLVALADGKLEAVEQEIVGVHLKNCGRCQEDVASFLEYRRQIEPELSVRYAPAGQRTFAESFLPQWNWSALSWRPVYALPLLVAVCGAILLLALFWKERAGERRLREVPSPSIASVSPTPPTWVSVTPTMEHPPSDSRAVPNETPSVAQLNAREAQRVSPHPRAASTDKTNNTASRTIERLALLNDGGREVRISKTGVVTGLDDLPPATQQLIKEALLAEEIALPPVVDELAGGKSGLRGAADKASPFTLLAPARTVITEAQPTFRWGALEGATSYRVMVADAGGLEVANSGLLPSDARSWTAFLPLKRGEFYSWVVVAMVNDKAITSPTPAAPEMKFKVLEERTMQELDRLKRTGGSRLALCVFYAQAGMLAEAEHELQLLVSNNPHSPLALKLLRSIQSRQ